MVISYDSNVFSKEEIEYYKTIAQAMVKGQIHQLRFRLNVDGRVACDYVAHGQPFERIRRITGYLTGDTNSWNDSKRAEESERVKHAV